LCHLSDRLPCLAPHARAHRRQRQLGGVAAAPCPAPFSAPSTASFPSPGSSPAPSPAHSLFPSTAPTPATSDATAPTRDMGRHKESGERSRERGFGPADGRRGRRRHESTARQVTLDDDWQRDVWEAEGARALGCVVVRRPFGSPVDTWHNTRCKQHVANSFLTCLSKISLQSIFHCAARCKETARASLQASAILTQRVSQPVYSCGDQRANIHELTEHSVRAWRKRI
jgi:hypothetical protein